MKINFEDRIDLSWCPQEVIVTAVVNGKKIECCHLVDAEERFSPQQQKVLKNCFTAMHRLIERERDQNEAT